MKSWGRQSADAQQAAPMSARKKLGIAAAAGAVAVAAGAAYLTYEPPVTLPDVRNAATCDTFARSAMKDSETQARETGLALKRMVAAGKINGEQAIQMQGMALGTAEAPGNPAIAYGVLKLGCTL